MARGLRNLGRDREKIDQQGTALAAGGRFRSETAEIDLIPLRHPKYAPAVAAERPEVLIQAALAAL